MTYSLFSLVLFASALAACTSTQDDTIGGNCGFPAAPTYVERLESGQPAACPATIPIEVEQSCLPTQSNASCTYDVSCANVLDNDGNNFTLNATISQSTTAGSFAGKLNVLFESKAGDLENCAYDETIQ